MSVAVKLFITMNHTLEKTEFIIATVVFGKSKMDMESRVMGKTVYFDRNGESGNIFYILSMVYKTIGKEKGNECWAKVQNCKSYEEALGIIEEYVHLEDLSK